MREKKQAKIIIALISISLIGGTITNVVIPVLMIKYFPPLADVFALFFAAGVVYTIVKYKEDDPLYLPLKSIEQEAIKVTDKLKVKS